MTDVLTENASALPADASTGTSGTGTSGTSGPSLSDFVTRAANGQAADGRRDLVGIPREELTELMAAMGESKFRVKQLWNWVYYRGVTDIEDMTNISKKLRDRLAQDFYVGRPVLTADQKVRMTLING